MREALACSIHRRLRAYLLLLVLVVVRQGMNDACTYYSMVWQANLQAAARSERCSKPPHTDSSLGTIICSFVLVITLVSPKRKKNILCCLIQACSLMFLFKLKKKYYKESKTLSPAPSPYYSEQYRNSEQFGPPHCTLLFCPPYAVRVLVRLFVPAFLIFLSDVIRVCRSERLNH